MKRKITNVKMESNMKLIKKIEFFTKDYTGYAVELSRPLDVRDFEQFNKELEEKIKKRKKAISGGTIWYKTP